MIIPVPIESITVLIAIFWLSKFSGLDSGLGTGMWDLDSEKVVLIISCG